MKKSQTHHATALPITSFPFSRNDFPRVHNSRPAVAAQPRSQRDTAVNTRPTVVLLPGLHGTAELFAPLLRAMPADVPRQVIAYPPHRCLRYRDLLQLIEQQLAGQDNLILVGESFSSAIALRFAQRWPARVRAVILCVGFVRPPVPRLLCYLGAPLALMRFPLPAFLLWLFLAGHDASPQLVRATRREIFRVRPHVLAWRVLLASTVNAQHALQNCRAPVLAISGRRDRLLGHRALRHMQHLRPDLKVLELNAPHLLLQTKPQEAWAAVSTVLNDAHQFA